MDSKAAANKCLARNNKSRTQENASPLDGLLYARPSLTALNKNRFRRGFIPDDVQRLEQRSMKREQAVLKSLIVMIALMFTTTAFAQEQCKSISLARSSLDRLMAHVETVPLDEADYIRREEDQASKEFFSDQPSISKDRIYALYKRPLYVAAKFHEYAGSVMKNFKAAERATSAKDVAAHLIDAMSGMPQLAAIIQTFIMLDSERKQPTLSEKDMDGMRMDRHLINELTKQILQCIVKGL